MGASIVARPFAHSIEEYEGSEMQNVKLTEHEKDGIYTMHCLGERTQDIADRYNIARSTAYRIISEQRKKQERKSKEAGDMAAKSKIVAGDKANGRLTSTTDPHRFEGTCVIGGRAKSKTFVGVNARNAQQQWEKWCQDLRDEQAFMDMVERKDEPERKPVPAKHDTQPSEDSKAELAESTVVCGYPLDPIEEIRPMTSDAVHDVQEEFDAATTKHMEATGAPLADTSEPAYLIWAKAPEPRCYGLYLTMDAALTEVDKLNAVAKFLGSENAFVVEEVAWMV